MDTSELRAGARPRATKAPAGVCPAGQSLCKSGRTGAQQSAPVGHGPGDAEHRLWRARRSLRSIVPVPCASPTRRSGALPARCSGMDVLGRPGASCSVAIREAGRALVGVPSGMSTGGGKQSPGARHAFQRVLTAVLELDLRPGDEIHNGA